MAVRNHQLARLALFLALSVAHTWPLATDLAHLSRFDHADARLNAWILTWVGRTLVHDPGRLFDAPMFHPEPDVLAYSESDRVSLSVGFYYMANACGRLLGTLLSGALYQMAGVSASLWGAVVLATIAGGVAMLLPPVATDASWSAVKGDD